MATSPPAESFRGLLLRHRGRTGLTQGQLADHIGVARRTIQDWESGLNYPTAGRLQAAILEAGGLAAGREADEAMALWVAADRESSRTHPPFDTTWFARLLAVQLTAVSVPATRRAAIESAACLQDWGEAPDSSEFLGRTDELARLRRWVLDERCRLVTVLGMGGIGTTILISRLALEVARSFERVYWRSLRDAPPPGEWLGGAIGFVSDLQLAPPPSDSERIALLLRLLRERRCLLVLDNSEALFEPGYGGRYRAGMDGYSRVLEALRDATHQSCLILTSREAPPELSFAFGRAVRSFQLGGLSMGEARQLMGPKQLVGSNQEWAELNARLGGNGLALKVVGETQAWLVLISPRQWSPKGSISGAQFRLARMVHCSLREHPPGRSAWYYPTGRSGG